MNRNRKGKALVTGGSRGIGRAIALRLADDGFDVAIGYHSSTDEAREVARDIRSRGVKGVAYQADLSKRSNAETLVKGSSRFLGGLNTLVNNAGIYERQPFDDLGPGDWRRTLSTNLDAVFYCTKAALPHMRAAGHGRVVNVSSILAHIGSSWGADYASSKAGILGLTRSLARELARDGITVNVVAPGAVDTDILAGDTPEKRREREEKIPLGRVGQPRDIAGVVAFLVSDDASYITGQTLNANGGQFML